MKDAVARVAGQEAPPASFATPLLIPCVRCPLEEAATYRIWIKGDGRRIELYLCDYHASQMAVHPSLWVWEQLAA